MLKSCPYVASWPEAVTSSARSGVLGQRCGRQCFARTVAAGNNAGQRLASCNGLYRSETSARRCLMQSTVGTPICVSGWNHACQLHSYCSWPLTPCRRYSAPEFLDVQLWGHTNFSEGVKTFIDACHNIPIRNLCRVARAAASTRKAQPRAPYLSLKLCYDSMSVPLRRGHEEASYCEQCNSLDRVAKFGSKAGAYNESTISAKGRSMC